jgi:protein phosphatase
VTPPGASLPPALPGVPVFAAWRRHRGNFRRDNEDSLWVGPLGAIPETPAPDGGTAEATTAWPGALAVVCDGVGGGAAGEVASALAVRSFVEHLAERAAAPPRPGPRAADLGGWMKQAAIHAHTRILAAVQRDRALEGMGTTLTAAWWVGDTLGFAQVGDSRLYRLRGGRLEQLSHDQSLVGRMRREGVLTEDQARKHPLRNIVDQVLGGCDAGVEPATGFVPVAPGDEFLLCSDGLSDGMSDAVLERKLAAGIETAPAPVVDGLLDDVLAASGRDNVSLVLVRPFRARASGAGAVLSRLGRLLRRGSRA